VEVIGKLNRGTRTAVVGCHTGVNELTVLSRRMKMQPMEAIRPVRTFLVDVVMVLCQGGEGLGCVSEK